MLKLEKILRSQKLGDYRENPLKEAELISNSINIYLNENLALTSGQLNKVLIELYLKQNLDLSHLPSQTSLSLTKGSFTMSFHLEIHLF